MDSLFEFFSDICYYMVYCKTVHCRYLYTIKILILVTGFWFINVWFNESFINFTKQAKVWPYFFICNFRYMINYSYFEFVPETFAETCYGTGYYHKFLNSFYFLSLGPLISLKSQHKSGTNLIVLCWNDGTKIKDIFDVILFFFK